VIASLPLLPDPRVSQADICQIAIIVGWVGQCRSRISFFFFCQTSASKTRIWTTSCVQYIREQIHFLCVRVSPILFHVVSFGLSAIRNETKPTPRCWHEWKHASCSSFLRNNKSKVVFFSQRAGVSFKVDNQLPNLVNLNEDPQLSELLLYMIKQGVTRWDESLCRSKTSRARSAVWLLPTVEHFVLATGSAKKVAIVTYSWTGRWSPISIVR